MLVQTLKQFVRRCLSLAACFYLFFFFTKQKRCCLIKFTLRWSLTAGCVRCSLKRGHRCLLHQRSHQPRRWQRNRSSTSLVENFYLLLRHHRYESMWITTADVVCVTDFLTCFCTVIRSPMNGPANLFLIWTLMLFNQMKAFHQYHRFPLLPESIHTYTWKP